MRALLLIAWREYRQYIFSRGFLLFLILMPLGAIFLGAALGFIEQTKPARRFAVVDLNGGFSAAVSEELALARKWDILAAWDGWLALAVDAETRMSGAIPYPFHSKTRSRARAEAFAAAGLDAARAAAAPFVRKNASPFRLPPVEFEEVPPPAEAVSAPSADAAAQILRPYLVGGAHEPIFAAVIIPEDFGPGETAGPAQYWSRNLTDRALKDAVSAALDHALRRRAAQTVGLSAGALERVLDADAPISEFRPDRAAEEAELGDRDRIEVALPAAMTYMLLVIVFGVGNLLLTNTIEERSNKIVEVLLSSVTANQLMWGKLLGIAAVGLTMPTIFTLTALLAAAGLGGGEISGEALATLFGSGLIFVYLFYFFCAYAIFAMIFLAIGSVSNSLQDAQSYMGPVMLVVMLPLPFMVMVYQNPNGLIATILTWIPIYTPYAVMMRAASDPPLFEIAGATALMLAFAVVLTRAMGRIFRHAILQSAPAKMRDIMRLARTQ